MSIVTGRHLSFAVPGDIQLPTSGYVYERRVMSLLPDYGVQPTLVQLPGRFAEPDGTDLTEAGRRLAACSVAAPILIDGTVLGALPHSLIEAMPHQILALVHHPLSLEPGLSVTRAGALKANEIAAFQRANHVIVTSIATKRLLTSNFAVPARKITVAEPGTDPASRASGTGTPLQLIAVGAVSARKGYDVLIEALSPLRHLDWRLVIAGATDRDADATAALERLIANAGFADRIRLAGAVVPATLARFYDTADIFVMPSLMEGHGMAVAEAMARGLPIVCTTTECASEAVPDAAAIKVKPGDVAALTAALERGLTDKKLRARMADASWEMGRTLPPWTETTRRIAAVVMGLSP